MRSARTRLTRGQIVSFGPFIGAEGDEGGTAGGTGGAPAGDGGSSTGGSTQPDPKDDGGTGKPGDDLDKVTDADELRRKLRNKSEEQDRQYRKLQEAERERDELKTKQEEQDRKGKTELENAKTDLENEKAKTTQLSDAVRRLTVENAFLKVDGVDWHDRADALRLIDLTDVQFDDKTGEVKDPKKVAEAAKKLAKDKPHLVKSATSAPTGTPMPTPGRTGEPPAPRNSNPVTDRDKLRNKYRIPQ